MNFLLYGDYVSLAEFAIPLIKGEKMESNLKMTSTQFSELDRMTGGLKPGELVLLAALPGAGKTTFALNIAGNLGFDYRGVVFFTHESNRVELINRLISSSAEKSVQDLKRGKIERGDIQTLLNSMEDVFNNSIEFLSDSNDIEDLFLEVQRAQERNMNNGSRELVIIDYLQYFVKPGLSNEVDVLEKLKSWGKRQGVPLLVTYQLERLPTDDDYSNPRPRATRLGEPVRSAADIVCFMHKSNQRPFSRTPIPGEIAEIIMVKNRADGELGNFCLLHRAEIAKFEDVA